MKRKKSSECDLFLSDFPLDVKLHFKAWCAKRNQTMKAAIIALMKQAIAEDLDEFHNRIAKNPPR